jgi:thiol-disulfide isomerase/thioredoxin
MAWTDLRWWAVGAGAAALSALVACGEAPPRLPDPPHPEQYWVERTYAELAAVLRETCTRAIGADKPVLLAFSAPWCIDCRQMRALEGQPELATELARWEKVVVDVGRLDRHRPLLEAFRVGAIAHWVALAPTDCREDVTRWPVLRASTFEPQTGWFGAKTAPELQAWLQDAHPH